MDNELHAKLLLLLAPLRISIAASGAGAGLQKILWNVPGISSVLFEANFPYAMSATDKFLGFKPDSYCSAKTAVEMAMQCYYRAFEFNAPKAIGIGISASVSTLREHRGDLRVFAAWFSDNGCGVYNQILPKRTDPDARIVDGRIADMIGLVTLLHSVGTASEGPINSKNVEYQQALDIAYDSFWERSTFLAGGKRTGPAKKVEALFPGSFNPPHEGHFGMAESFRKVARLNPTFHVTANPPHKAPLAVHEMLQRAKMLEGYDRMFTKDDPLYLQKAEKYPMTPIILGVDSLASMLDPKWGVTPQTLGKEFARLGTDFWTSEERELPDQVLRSKDVEVPSGMIVHRIPGKWQASSSSLRATSSSSSKA